MDIETFFDQAASHYEENVRNVCLPKLQDTKIKGFKTTSILYEIVGNLVRKYHEKNIKKIKAS